MSAFLIKNTKNNTKFKETNLFLIKEIMNRLEIKGWEKYPNSKEKEEYEVIFSTTEYPYCWDSISLVEKRLSINNWIFKLKSYYRTSNDTFSYNWIIKNKV